MNQPSVAPQKNKSMPTRAPPGIEPPRQTAATGDNQAIQAMLRNGHIQAKLTISHPGDADELEADRVAEQVMRNENPLLIGSSTGAIHRKCAACDAGGETCPKCAEEVRAQRKPMPGSRPRMHTSMRALRGPGQPLAGPIRAFFEPRFGMDLGSVRVHTSALANQGADAIGARAFTVGPDIAFAHNQFAPETVDGRRLLAHELTHVIQQSNGGFAPRIARDTGSQAAPMPEPSAAAALPFGQPVACYAPKGETITFEGVLLAANTEYLNGELRDYIAKHGEDGATEFSVRLRQHVGKKIQKADDYDVDDPARLVGANVDTSATLAHEAKISTAVDQTLQKILISNKEWMADFEEKANAVVLGMLQESEDRVNQERIRYGISWQDVERTGYRMAGPRGMVSYKMKVTEHSMQDTPGSRALAEAATGLLARKRKSDQAREDWERFSNSIHGTFGVLAKQRLGAGADKEMLHLAELQATYQHAKRDLDVFRSQKTGEFPVLAAYTSEEKTSEESVEKLEELASGKSQSATTMLGEEIKSRLEHIADVRKDIKEDGGKETKIWRVPRIIDGTRAITGALPGTMYGRLVDDKVKHEEPGIWTSILLGLLQLALVLLAPATGGLTLIPAAAISVGQAYVQFKEYERAQMLRGTDFGAMALSAEDPSLFWLAVDIVGAVVDVGAAAGAAMRVFRSLAPAARAARAARATKSVEAAEEAARVLEREAGELGGETLAKAVGAHVRDGSEAMHVGETASEARSLERASAQMAEQELASAAALESGVGAAESVAGRMVKVSESGALWSCASPCTLLRERYRGLLQRSETWEREVKLLEDEAAGLPKGKAGADARQRLAKRAAALETEMRTKALPGDWTSPLKQSKSLTKDAQEFEELVKRRGSIAAQLDHHPQNWTGADEARFRYGNKVDAEPNYRWTLDENGGLRYDRLDASLPIHQYNAATGTFEIASEGTLKRAVKGAVTEHDLGKLPKAQQDAMTAAFKERGKLIAKRDLLEDAAKLSKDDSEKLSKLYAQINEQSRQLGENAAEAVMKGKGRSKIYPSGKPHSTSGDFDQVWKAGDEFHIVEAKGGSSGLGSRAISEGVRAEQGTVEYALSVAKNMEKNGATKEIRKLGFDLQTAIAKGKVKYVLVRAPVGEEMGKAVLRDVQVSEFVIK